MSLVAHRATKDMDPLMEVCRERRFRRESGLDEPGGPGERRVPGE
jgi:hypothetical protein